MKTSSKYHLYGKIIHTGDKADGGHYYCEMRLGYDNKDWYLFNDREVKK